MGSNHFHIYMICSDHLLVCHLEIRNFKIHFCITFDFRFSRLKKISGSQTSLPVRIMLRPLKKRFQFHFTGTRQTARIDRPEWFLTQTLTWIKDHRKFVNDHVQPVADKLELSHNVVVTSIHFY